MTMDAIEYILFLHWNTNDKLWLIIVILMKNDDSANSEPHTLI
jgi:hypothetical protein